VSSTTTAASRPPAPPRRPPVRYAPLTPAQRVTRSLSSLVAVLFFAFILNTTVLSHLQHTVSQQLLFNTLREQLAEGTAPVSEGDFDDVLLTDGDPVAILRITSIGLEEVVVEGTNSGALMLGPGHRRDTVLPGQVGESVIMGRAAAYGGPFSRIQELQPGASIIVITGQGEQRFTVIGVRYAGDPTPPALQSGESRLVLQTARGAAYLPTGVAYVDAELASETQSAGPRQTIPATLPLSAQPLQGDGSTLWALVFALQLLVAAEIAAVWLLGRVGGQKVWIVFVPVLFLAGLWVATQVNLLLPNLL